MLGVMSVLQPIETRGRGFSLQFGCITRYILFCAIKTAKAIELGGGCALASRVLPTSQGGLHP